MSSVLFDAFDEGDREFDIMDDAAVRGERQEFSELLGLPLDKINIVASRRIRARHARRPRDRLDAQISEAEVQISLSWAIALQHALLEGFSQPNFQNELLMLLRECGGPDSAGHLPGRRELCLTVQREILPKFGFEGNESGVCAAVQTLEAMMVHSLELFEGAVAIHDALGLGPPRSAPVSDPKQHNGVPWACVH
eukprot:gnl/TRDRNA2_/TRDRNA2_185153_c0_seq1.p1 gnl/TRDRNA2_/TRDRNA2_185153_c0~~gnl/TRDRNA2_/TRDRNA2_185153_c0_seq1.p1  ORF type:complete len:195 (-),score=46.82 gnl/TRDRNA2_/TRDRNA2_185153_c0_seq1:42-626(-)